MTMIRLLKANEIEARVQVVKNNGFSLLLYKDARVDMSILDETFGKFGWQRRHEIIGDRLYCTISIYDKETNQWIDKQDVGTESYTEKEKGQASDSFKRAAFNVGIGRELYTAPFIWINNDEDVVNNNGKLSVKTRFQVSEIGYNENREISHLVIVDNKGTVRYQLGQRTNNNAVQENRQENKELISQPQQKRLFAIAKSNAELVKGVIKNYGHESTSTITKQEYQGICDDIEHLMKVAGE